MPKLLVPLIGSGKEGDAYRVDLPSYSMLAIDYDAMTAIVEVPKEDLPAELSSEQPQKLALEGQELAAVQLQPRHETALRDHLAERYNPVARAG